MSVMDILSFFAPKYKYEFLNLWKIECNNNKLIIKQH